MGSSATVSWTMGKPELLESASISPATMSSPKLTGIRDIVTLVEFLQLILYWGLLNHAESPSTITDAVACL